jgi:UPF0755 protein
MPRTTWRRALTALATAALTAALACGGPRDAKPVRVVVPRGASVRAVAESLDARGVIGSSALFRAYAAWSDRDRAFKPGTYEFRPGVRYAQIVDALVSGKGVVRVVTVVEGWEIRQIVPQLARVLDVPRDSVEAAVRDTALRARRRSSSVRR